MNTTQLGLMKLFDMKMDFEGHKFISLWLLGATLFK